MFKRGAVRACCLRSFEPCFRILPSRNYQAIKKGYATRGAA